MLDAGAEYKLRTCRAGNELRRQAVRGKCAGVAAPPRPSRGLRAHTSRRAWEEWGDAQICLIQPGVSHCVAGMGPCDVHCKMLQSKAAAHGPVVAGLRRQAARVCRSAAPALQAA